MLTKKTFGWGLLFVAFSYAIIKLIDNYPLFFEVVLQFYQVISPFVIGIIIAYLLNPLVVVLETRGNLSRGLSVLTTYSVILVICFMSLIFTVPMLLENARELIKHLPVYLVQIEDVILKVVHEVDWQSFTLFSELEQKLTAAIPDVANLLTDGLTSVFKTGFKVFGAVGNGAFALFLSIYLLLEKETFLVTTKRFSVILLKEQRAERLGGLCQLLHQNIGRYIVAKGFDSLIMGTIAAVVLQVLGVPYSALFGVMLVVLNMIPIVGPLVGTCLVVGFSLLHSWTLGLYALIALLVIQQFEMFVLEPKIVGQQLGLNPFLTLLSVTVGGHFFGAMGMILGVPVTGIIKQLSLARVAQIEAKTKSVKASEVVAK